MSQSLCSTCREIDFRKYMYESRFRAIKLGTWEKISKRDGCSFCSLALDAITPVTGPPSSGSILKLSNRKSWKCCTSYNEYHGIREMDYSNEFDLHDYGVATHSLSRYQFYLYWDEEPETRVYLRPLRPGPFFGRPVDRGRADLALCRTWLDLCDKHHSGSSERCHSEKKSRRSLQEFLRLIDVEKMIIVRGSTVRDEYVALSYVWGEDKLRQERPPGWQMPRTLRAAVRTDEFGVETIPLPAELLYTIRDAIEVTRSIGFRYLWVDSLCIIQDDRRDQELQISMMDEIYNNATLTIGAGSGMRESIEIPSSSSGSSFR